MRAWIDRTDRAFTRAVRAQVLLMAVLSGACVVLMMATTCADVVLRACGRPLTGSLDVVSVLAALAICFALPYTTAVKGHVAVEYFFHRLSPVWRVVVDTLIRLLVLGLFALVAAAGVAHGRSLARSGTVSPTLELPLFWVPWVLAFCCVVASLVVLYNLLHPGRVMVRP